SKSTEISMKRLLWAAVALGAGLFLAGLDTAKADLYTITDCSNGLGCGTGNNFGTVSTSNISGGVEVSISLSSTTFFLGNFDPSIMWDLKNISSAVINGVTHYAGYIPATGSTLTAGSHHPDGIGTFNYGITWGGCTSPPSPTCNGAAKGNLNQTLAFDLLATGLTTASFVAGTNSPTGNPLFFAFDIGRGCTIGESGKLGCVATGFAGATLTAVPGPAMGAGLPGLIAACMGLVVFARRRRQRFASGH